MTTFEFSNIIGQDLVHNLEQDWDMIWDIDWDITRTNVILKNSFNHAMPATFVCGVATDN